MTGTELLATMRKDYPKVQLRDISRLLRQFEERKVICCLTPREVTGRLYFFTDKGRRFMRETFGISLKPLPLLVNWSKYAQVFRSEVRKLVLLQMDNSSVEQAKTITMLRKQVNAKYPLSLGGVIRAIRELEQLNVVQRVGLTKKRSRPLYFPTIIGKRIIKLLSSKPGIQSSESSDGKALLEEASADNHEEENQNI